MVSVPAQYAAGTAAALAAFAFLKLGQNAAIIVFVAAMAAWFKYLRGDGKPTSTRSYVDSSEEEEYEEEEEEEESVALDTFYDFVYGITQGRGGASTSNIVFAIANLADARGLWTYSARGCIRFDPQKSNTTSETMADFCRKNPKRSTLQDIPGIGSVLAKDFARAGYPTTHKVLKKFMQCAKISKKAVNVAVVLDRFFDWVSKVQKKAGAPVACSHTVVHCVSELAHAIELIKLDKTKGKRYDQEMSNSTAGSIKDVIDAFDGGFGSAGDIQVLKGVGPVSAKAFAKERIKYEDGTESGPIKTIDLMLDKFMTFIY
jgi:predicted flap endonuclease-1-like 5' DNA nuclease